MFSRLPHLAVANGHGCSLLYVTTFNSLEITAFPNPLSRTADYDTSSASQSGT
jgi:hypothetical protein